MSLMVRKTASLTSDGVDYNAEFREIIDREFPGLEGRQSPQEYVYADGGDFTHGEKAVKLARRFGVTLMPWQREQVLRALAIDAEGHWLHQDIVLLCPRQNGKSLILEVIILYRLFVLHHQIVFSAHQWRTAKSIRNRIWKKIKSKPWAARRLVRNTASAGEAEMETAEGGKLQFSTRSNDMGRGFDEIDLLLLDEAYNLESGELEAVAPTQLAAEDPQTVYTSSAVNRFNHPKGEELSRIRDRALNGDNEGMLFAEFAAPAGMDRDDPLAHKLANPSYGFPKLVDAKKMRSMRSKLTDNGFDVEMMGWGLWFDLRGPGQHEFVFPMERWRQLVVDRDVRVGECVLGVEVSPDSQAVAFVMAGQTRAGVHLMAREAGMEFEVTAAVEFVSRMVDEFDPAAVVLDKDAPAAVMVAQLQQVGIEPVQLNGGLVSLAFRELRQAVVDGTATHDGASLWESQLQVAVERKSKDGKYPSIDRFSGDVSELVAATFAAWGLTTWLAGVESGQRKAVESKPVNPLNSFPMFKRKKLIGGVLVA